MTTLMAAVFLVAAAVVTVYPRHVRRRLVAIRGHAPAPWRDEWSAVLTLWLDRFPRRTWLAAGVMVGVVLLVWQGPVAGVIGAGYTAVGVRTVLRRRAKRRSAMARIQVADAISGLATDLRAGLLPAAALQAALPAFLPAAGPDATQRFHDPAQEIGPVSVVERCVSDPDRKDAARRLLAAWRLAERTGAPLADVLERLDADLRAQERLRSSVAAQTAGARATAGVLAALPLAGVALGYAVGLDPLAVLLHTPVGGALALAAVALQLAGLTWAARLSRVSLSSGAA